MYCKILMPHHTRKTVARPRNIKNPILSVLNVNNTDDPIAGSLPIFCKNNGTSIPTPAPTIKLSSIAPNITNPSAIFP